MPVLAKTDPKPLFVYGDLRKGEKSHDEMKGTGFLGEVSTTDEYEKKPEGLAHGHTSVKGELYKVSPGKLKKLDDFELDRYERRPVRLEGEQAAQAYLLKKAKVKTELLPHQRRVVERIQKEDQPGLLVAHGLGSGKTLTSIAAQDALGVPATVILPAALQANYEKEREKHLAGQRQAINMLTLQAAARRGEAPSNPLLVVDEAHRLREPTSAGLAAVKGTEAQKRMLLTATPFYNAPSDIAPLINVVSGGKLLPELKPEFEAKFVRERKVKPGLWGRVVRGETPGLVREVNPITAPYLQNVLHKYVDYHPSSEEGFPTVTREDIRTPMTRQQLKVYDTMMKQAPPWVAAKIKSGLPPSKKESQELNAFLSAVRQVSNTTAGFQPGADAHQPKIQAAFENLKKTLDENERAKAIVYSNYLESGIAPYRGMLQAANIPFGEFTGEMKKKERDQIVKDYNVGKIRALLLSSAGGEGLDLKGTRLIQTLDPHWNIEKIRQVEGRGVRYGSHADLPEEERNVAIQRYLATRSPRGIMERLGLKKPGGGVDEYLASMSEEKEKLHEQFRKLLPGYEKKAGAMDVKTAGLRINKNALKSRLRAAALEMDPVLDQVRAYSSKREAENTKEAAADPKYVQGMKRSLNQFLKAHDMSPKEHKPIVAAGTAMYLHGLGPEPRDLDVFIPTMTPHVPDAHVVSTHGKHEVDAHNEWMGFDKSIIDNAQTIHGVKVMAPPQLLEMYEHLNRPKDQERIELLRGIVKKGSAKGYYKGLPSDPEGVKFKVNFQGIEVRVERPKGFIMVGKDDKGVNWARRYKLDYGHIPKTLGGDGDGLDVFLGPDKKANEAYWAIQRKDDGTFDEYKVFLGFPDRDAAASAYRQHIPKKYLKGIITMKVSMMKAMLGKVEPEELMKAACFASFLDELAWLERTSCAS